MNSVWAVTENRGGEIDLLKITETKKVAEKYVNDRFSLHFEDNYKCVVFTDQPYRKVWVIVDADEFAKYDDPEDYFDECFGDIYLIIEKWNVLKAK